MATEQDEDDDEDEESSKAVLMRSEGSPEAGAPKPLKNQPGEEPNPIQLRGTQEMILSS